MMKKSAVGFTLIELMIAMTVSLFVIGTYLRFFSHSVKIEASTQLKSNITVKGEHILDTLENSMRLAGLGNTSTQFKAGTVIVSADGIAEAVSAGNVFADGFNFTFESPYGGPVTKVLTAQGSIPGCTITLQSSAALYSGMPNLLIINRNNIYQATLSSMNGNQITTATMTPTPVGTSCGDAFPAGTLVTGLNRIYSLNTTGTTGGACAGCVNFTEQIGGGTNPIALFSYPKAEMPFFAVQFLTETVDAAGVATRAWITSVNDCNTPLVVGTANVCSTIKAVRFGFVLTAKGEREGTPAATSFQYCLFDDSYCFAAPADTNKRYLAFSRTVYLRNIDSLQRNLLEF